MNYTQDSGRRRMRVPTIATLIFFGVLAAAGLALGAQSHNRARRTLPGLVPGFTQTLDSLGSTANGAPVELLANLKLRHEGELQSLIASVSDPSSPSYGHYISSDQFNARYAPSAKALSAVESFARKSDLTVASVPANNRYVELRGTVADAEQAFDTNLEDFRLEGSTVHAPVSDPSIPASLGRFVSQVTGLDTGAYSKPLSIEAEPNALPPTGNVNAKPCSKSYGEKKAKNLPKAYGKRLSYVPCGYSPKQLQRAYGIRNAIHHGNNGRGQKVAIIDAYSSPTIKQDASTYSKRHGLPKPKITINASAAAMNAQEAPPAVDPQGWAGEETLDVEAVHAMAPKAKIKYYGADTPLNAAFAMTLNKVVSENKAQIISNSYGSAGDFDNSMDVDPILEQAAAQGIGAYYSSGDLGDETKDPDGPGDREVDSIANDPLVTAVGGTSLAVGKQGKYKSETYWGTSSAAVTGNAFDLPGEYLYGGGGGVSQTYAQPRYQKGVVPKDIANYFKGDPPQADAGDANGNVHSPGRAVPDVSMVGDPNTGFLSGITQDYTVGALSELPVDLPIPIGGVTQSPTDDFHYGEYRIGGTSLSAPLFAGVMALADQKAHMRHGFANPALYKAYKHHRGAFRDVRKLKRKAALLRHDYVNGLDKSGGVKASVRTLGVLNTLHLRKGYDDSTGLGSPHGSSFLKALGKRKKH